MRASRWAVLVWVIIVVVIVRRGWVGELVATFLVLMAFTVVAVVVGFVWDRIRG